MGGPGRGLRGAVLPDAPPDLLTVTGFAAGRRVPPDGAGCPSSAQTAALLDGTDLPLSPCLLGKLTHGLLSVLLAALVSLWLF